VTDLDPATEYSNEISAMQNVYESLTRYNAQTRKAEPLLATSWTKSSDGLVWTFTLRKGVTFHDGRAMDATAVKESIDRNRSANAGASYIWGAVDSIATPDASTVKFQLKYPVPLDLVASSGYSAYIYDVKAAGSADLAKWFNSGKDAGTGPYTIGSWKKGAETELTLDKNTKYWGGWSGKHFTSVQFRVTPDTNTAWQLLQSGQVDYVPFLTPQLFEKAKTTSSVQTSESPTFENLNALYNTATGPMADVRVRKAISLAIDYQGLVASLAGAGVEASGVVPKGLLGYTPGLEGTTDMAQAKTLLQQAGYGPSGKKLQLTMTYAQGDDAQAKLATLLTSAVQELGGTLTATPMDWNAQWDLGKSTDTSKHQDIFVMYWYPDYPDAYSWFYNEFHSQNPTSFNLTYYSDKELDAQIDALPALTATDPAAAEKQYAQLQKTILQDKALASVPFVQNAQRVLSSRVGGFVDNPAYQQVVHVYDLTVKG
jgi:peptide/nickel transport system substrate-binding protein